MIRRLYRAHGAVRQLYRVSRWPKGTYQILLEGPAGTGKSRGLLEWVHWLCDEWPGIRVLFLRRTKESLAESTLDTWENHVLFPGHPCMVGQAGPHHRQFYHFPNGSHIVLGGVKDKTQVEKTLSTQYDVVVFFEAREILDFNTWQMLARPNRNWKMPWQIRIADTNPGAEFHWLNQYFPKPEDGGAYRHIPKRMRDAPPFTLRCEDRHVNVIPRPAKLLEDERGKLYWPCPTCKKKAKGANMFRLLSRHRDNPVFWDHEGWRWTEEGAEYVESTLGLLTGAPYANLYEGRWASEEGVIYEDWDPAIHIVDEAPEKPDWYFGAFDKGLRHPGCFQVWAVQGDTMYRVLELYRTNQNLDWWAEQVELAQRRYGLEAVVCDPSEPEYIQKFNEAMGEKRGRGGEPIARRAVNAILTGIGVVRTNLSQANDGPRIFLVRHSLDGKDPVRVAQMKPACLEEEIGSYIWSKTEDGKPAKERPDPTCADHAMDCLRYAAMFMWGKEIDPDYREPEFSPWSYGDVLDHGDVLAGMEG